jgi:hypothetical protein
MPRDIHNDARTLLGFNGSFNPAAGDGYFAKDCERHWGGVKFDEALRQVRAEEEAKAKLAGAAPALAFALKQISELAPGSAGAYRKFSHAQNIASRALREAGIT